MKVTVITVALFTAFYAGMEAGWSLHRSAIKISRQRKLEDLAKLIKEAGK